MLSKILPLLFFLIACLDPSHLGARSTAVSEDSLNAWTLVASNAQVKEVADEAYGKLLNGLLQNGDSTQWRRTQMMKADLYADTEWDSPIALLQDAIDQIWWKADNNTAFLYMYLGYYAEEEGDLILSMESREQVYNMIRTEEIPWSVYLISNVLRPLGNQYTSFGELQKAHLLLESSYQYLLSNEIEDDVEELALVGSDLAVYYHTSGERSRSKEIYEELLKSEFLSAESKSLLYINLAGVLVELGDVSGGEGKLNLAIALIKKEPESRTRSELLAGAYSNLSALLLDNAELNKAYSSAEQAIKYGNQAFPFAYSREMAGYYLQKAGVEGRMGEYKKALVTCQMSLKKLLPGYQIGDLGSLGNTNRYYPENRLWQTFTLQGELLLKLYEATEVADFLAKSLRAHEAAMQVEALQLQLFEYDNSSLMLLAANRNQKSDAVSIAWKLYELSPSRVSFFKALSIAERSRSLLLQDRKNQLALMAGNQVDPLIVRQIDKVDSLMAQAQIDLRDLDPESISYLQQEVFLDSLVTKSYALRDHLLTTSPLYASARFGDLSFDLDGFQDRLPTGVLVVSYFLSKEEIYVFGITNKKEAFFRLPIPQTLNQRINDLSEAITFPYMGRPSSLAMFDSVRREISLSLYHDLVEPLLAIQEFAETNRLWIIPDGIIGRIPFALLLTEKPTSPYYANEAFLIRERSLAMASNLTLMYLQLLNGHSRSETELLCVAPSYETAGMGTSRSVGTDMPVSIPEGVRLVFHLQEAEYLNKRYGGGYLYEKGATIPAFMQEASEYSILHFSGHAQPDSATGLWNFLALEPEAGSLDAFAAFWQPQILALRLNAAMVYLSACETSRGKFYQGEGHSSLARAFLYAGSESVVATLWQIDDSVSLRFSQRFYENLEAGVPKDIAMQQTMISMIDENRPPYAWSPYLMWGATEPIILRQRNEAWKYLIAGGAVLLLVALLILRLVQSRIRKRTVDTLPN